MKESSIGILVDGSFLLMIFDIYKYLLVSIWAKKGRDYYARIFLSDSITKYKY